MLSKLALLTAAWIAVPAFAANTSGPAAASNMGVHNGGFSAGGASHGGEVGAHNASVNVHAALQAAHATLHTPVTQSRHMALTVDAKPTPKPGHDHQVSSHIFLHQATRQPEIDWESWCIPRNSTSDVDAWSDCGRPAKSNPHSGGRS